MKTKVRLSKQGALEWADALRGAILAALSSVLTLVYDLLAKGDLDHINWKAIGISAATVFIGYLIKNGALEPPKVITTVANNDKAAEVKIDINKAI